MICKRTLHMLRFYDLGRVDVVKDVRFISASLSRMKLSREKRCEIAEKIQKLLEDIGRKEFQDKDIVTRVLTDLRKKMSQ